MQSSAAHKIPEAKISDKDNPQPHIRFIEATPSSEQVRKETRALIRAHASRFSWARLKIQKNRLPLDPKASISSTGGPLEFEPGPIKRKIRQQYTESKTVYQNLDSESAPEVEDQFSHSLPEPNSSESPQDFRRFADVGVSFLDPFESYSSSLPKDAVSPLFDQGQ
jgi:hypothetical protein